MTNSLDKLARRILRIEREVKHLGRTPQLAYSSVEDGAINVNDASGTTTMIMGRQFDGSTAPAVVSGPPPPQPSAPILEAMPGGVVVEWDGTFVDSLVAPMDFARVEIHSSQEAGFQHDLATTLRTTIESPRGGKMIIKVPYDVTEHFILVARSLSGKASIQSAEVAGAALKVESVDLAADAIDGRVIRGVEIVGGLMKSGRIEVGEAYWDPIDGLVFPQPDGGAIRLPVDGVTAARITAHLIARSLDVEDNANFYGLSQLMGTFRMANGINNPATPPSVSRTWDSIHTELADDDIVAPKWVLGACQTVGNPNQITVVRRYFGANIRQISKDTGEVDPFIFPSWDNFYPQGITSIGNYYYMLGQINGVWKIYKLDVWYNQIDEWNLDIGSTYWPAIGNDGTNVLVATAGSSGNVFMRKLGTALGTLLDGPRVIGSMPSGADLTHIGYGALDFGANRWVVTTDRGDIYTFNDSGSRVTSTEWDTAGSSKIRGLVWDGARYWHIDGSGTLWKYESGAPTTRSVDVGYTWFDDVDPDHETMISPLETFVWPARSRLEIEASPAPQVDILGNVEAANQVRIYAALTGSAPRLQATLPVGTRTFALAALDTASATSPLANGFDGLGVTPGRMESTKKDSGGRPLTELHGDGTTRAAKLIQSGKVDSGALVVNTLKDVNIPFPVPFDSVPEVQATLSTTHSPVNFYPPIVRNITTTGFTVGVVRNTGTAAVDIMWTATVAR